MTKRRGRGHLKRPRRPAKAALPERAEREGLPPPTSPEDAHEYDWVYDAEDRNLVHEYGWVSAANGHDVVYSATGRRARLLDSAWVLEP